MSALGALIDSPADPIRSSGITPREASRMDPQQRLLLKSHGRRWRTLVCQQTSSGDEDGRVHRTGAGPIIEDRVPY